MSRGIKITLGFFLVTALATLLGCASQGGRTGEGPATRPARPRGRTKKFRTRSHLTQPRPRRPARVQRGGDPAGTGGERHLLVTAHLDSVHNAGANDDASSYLRSMIELTVAATALLSVPQSGS